MAGIYEVWGAGTPDALPTVSMFTRPANAFMSAIHHRMPVLLQASDRQRWLDPSVRGIEPAAKLLREFAEKEPPRLESVVISSRVNSPAHDDPSLWDPVSG